MRKREIYNEKCEQPNSMTQIFESKFRLGCKPEVYMNNYIIVDTL